VQETFLITVLSMLKSVLLPNIFVENVFFPHYLFLFIITFKHSKNETKYIQIK